MNLHPTDVGLSKLFKHSRDAEKRGDDLKNWEVLDLFLFVGDVIKR